MTRASVQVGVLGPLTLVVDGHPVEVPGPRRRAVLALLALAGGRVVSTDRLLDAVWPDEVPASGRRALHSHVSRLRGHLGAAADRLEREGDGYRLALAPDELDATHARALGDAAARVEPGEAAGLLAEALGLWRGPALGEFTDVAPLAAEAVALSELHDRLTDDCLEARLAGAGTASPGDPGLGRDGARSDDRDLLEDAARAAADAPLRERTNALHVRALAAAGRQAEALRAAHAFRHRLADDTGLSPGDAFDALEQEVALGVLAPQAAAPPRRAPARPSSPFVGRDHEVAALRRHLRTHRLTSVVGPGGVGKTRLTLEVVSTLANGSGGHDGNGKADGGGDLGDVVVVELASVEGPARVADTLADMLGARGRATGQAVEACIAALGSRPTLVLLDNCEHVLDTARDLVAELVAACPHLTVLVTSREPLGLPDEHLLRLGPLSVPEEGSADPGRSPAVAAFLAHARRRQPDLVVSPQDAPLVAELARRLDGLPLALELAAGRVGTLALPDLHARLDRALDLFSAGRASSSARHRTLRAAIDWSYQALDDDARALLRALSVFPGGVDLATAERIGERLGLSDDPAAVLSGLVEASVLVADSTTRRFRALETVRAFALDALEAAGERDRAEAEMVAWAVDLADRLDVLSMSVDEASAGAVLQTELPNLTAAWDAAGRRGDLGARVALVVNLDNLATYRGLPVLPSWALELADDPALADHPDRLAALGAAACAAWMVGELDRSEELVAQALVPGAPANARYRALEAASTVKLYRGDPVGASEGWETAAGLVPPGLVTSYLAPAGLAAAYADDIDRAEALLARAEAAAKFGAPSALAFARYSRAEMLAGREPDRAVELYGEAIELARASGAEFVEGIASVGLVRLWATTGRSRQALAGYGSLLEMWRRSGYWPQLWTTLRNLAGALAQAGQARAAALALAAADAAPDASAVSLQVVADELAAVAEQARRDLGEEAFAAACDEGARLPRSDVVDLALAAIAAALAQ